MHILLVCFASLNFELWFNNFISVIVKSEQLIINQETSNMFYLADKLLSRLVLVQQEASDIVHSNKHTSHLTAIVWLIFKPHQGKIPLKN